MITVNILGYILLVFIKIFLLLLYIVYIYIYIVYIYIYNAYIIVIYCCIKSCTKMSIVIYYLWVKNVSLVTPSLMAYNIPMYKESGPNL